MESTRLEQDSLEQLAAVPGVVGSLVFDRSGAVIVSAFPPVFDPAGLHRLAAQLSADGYFQDWVGGDDAALQLRYVDGQVVLRSVDGSWLLVLCTVQANAQLLSMSLTQVVRRLRAQLRKPVPAAPAPPSPLERLRGIVSAELGEHAARALEILGAAGSRPKDLVRASAEIEEMTRLFISRKKAEEIGATMRKVLEGTTRAGGST